MKRKVKRRGGWRSILYESAGPRQAVKRFERRTAGSESIKKLVPNLPHLRGWGKFGHISVKQCKSNGHLVHDSNFSSKDTLSVNYSFYIAGDYGRLSTSTSCKASPLGYEITILSHSSISKLFPGPSVFPLPVHSKHLIKSFLYSLTKKKYNDQNKKNTQKITAGKNAFNYKAEQDKPKIRITSNPAKPRRKGQEAQTTRHLVKVKIHTEIKTKHRTPRVAKPKLLNPLLITATHDSQSSNSIMGPHQQKFCPREQAAPLLFHRPGKELPKQTNSGGP